MIELLGRLVASPAELLTTLCWPVALGLALVGRRWPRTSAGGLLLLSTGLLALAVAGAGFRDLAAGSGLMEVGPENLAGALGRGHADAARLVWWVGLVVGSAWTARAWVDERSDGPLFGGWVAVVAGGTAAMACPYEPAITAAFLFSWSAVARGRSGSRALGVGALWLGLAALAGADARTYHDAALWEVGDVDRFAADGVASGLGLVAAFALWSEAARASVAVVVRRGVALAVVLSPVLAGRSEALDHGPHPELAAWRGVVPQHVPSVAHRVPFACLVAREDDQLVVRSLGRRWFEPQCAEKGAFVRNQRAVAPLFALAGSEPASTMEGWFRGAGDARLLVELPGRGLPAWRMVGIEVPIWPAPENGDFLDPAGRPEAGAVVLEGGRLVWSGGSEPIAADVRTAVARAAGDRPRVDLILPAAEVGTVEDLLRVCGAAREARPTGLRCVLGAGDWRGWRSR